MSLPRSDGKAVCSAHRGSTQACTRLHSVLSLHVENHNALISLPVWRLRHLHRISYSQSHSTLTAP